MLKGALSYFFESASEFCLIILSLEYMDGWMEWVD